MCVCVCFLPMKMPPHCLITLTILNYKHSCFILVRLLCFLLEINLLFSLSNLGDVLRGKIIRM